MVLNRAVACSLNLFWKRFTVSGKLIRICRRLASEMLLACCVLPWCYSDLRLRTDETVSATDASGSAGGISRSVRLSKAGMEALRTRSDRGYQYCSEEFAILSWFDSIGAIRQAWVMSQLPLGETDWCQSSCSRRRRIGGHSSFGVSRDQRTSSAPC